MGEALCTMALSAVGGGLLAATINQRLGTLDRIVLVSVAGASFALSACLLKG